MFSFEASILRVPLSVQADLCSSLRGDPIHAGEQSYADVHLDGRV